MLLTGESLKVFEQRLKTKQKIDFSKQKEIAEKIFKKYELQRGS